MSTTREINSTIGNNNNCNESWVTIDQAAVKVLNFAVQYGFGNKYHTTSGCGGRFMSQVGLQLGFLRFRCGCLVVYGNHLLAMSYCDSNIKYSFIFPEYLWEHTSINSLSQPFFLLLIILIAHIPNSLITSWKYNRN